MSDVPAKYSAQLDEIHRALEGVDGWLTEREIAFLTLLAACPTCDGDILEIGAYRGKSTIVLAKAAKLAGGARLVTVDPLPDDGPMGRGRNSRQSARAQLDANLKRAGVADCVEVHQCYSQDFAPKWQGRLRLLWLDGAENYDVVRGDIQSFSPSLGDGGIIAMHDVLNASGERIRGFMEHVLKSPHFGCAGVCGSIGWAQYRSDPIHTIVHRKSKNRLYRLLAPLVRYHGGSRVPRGLPRLFYKLLRARVPHRAVDPDGWVRMVA
ncbi:MAG: class I SAM-dependent methyltransferase [Pirellulaceae bacterium]